MISVKNFSKNYKNKIVIGKSSFNIKSNSITFIMGENGAGKTTFIKCLTGLENYQGSITFETFDKKDALVIWDDTPFFRNLTGLQNLKIFGEGKCNKSEIEKHALKYLNMETLKRKVRSYSYGQKKRLALVLVDILKPRLLCMDEITNGLDFDSIRVLKKNLIEWSENMTILLTGHHLEFYDEVTNDVCLIKNQRIIPIKDYRTNSKGLEDIYVEELS